MSPIRAAALVARCRDRCTGWADARGLRATDARAQQRSGPDRGSPCGVGRPSLSRTREFTKTVHQISTGCSLPSSTGGIPKAKSEFPTVRVTDMCNASTARFVMPPWSGRQMTSFLSQSKPRNTHLVASYSLSCLEGVLAETQLLPRTPVSRRSVCIVMNS